jgi:hypothetical protein
LQATNSRHHLSNHVELRASTSYQGLVGQALRFAVVLGVELEVFQQFLVLKVATASATSMIHQQVKDFASISNLCGG